jgi:hypothetical protein
VKRLGVALIFVFALTLVGCDQHKPVPWEYKVIKTESDLERLGSDAMKAFTVIADEDTLNAIGDSNWELVTAYVEHNTAFPNFGKDEYVTGMRPNVRPSAVVFVFKRPKVPTD